MKLPHSDQSDFAASVGALLDKRDPLEPMRHRVGVREFDVALWHELVDLGVLEPTLDGDVLTASLLAEEFGRRCAPLPYLSAIVGSVVESMAGGPGMGTTTYGFLDARGNWSTEIQNDAGTFTGTLPFVPDADVAERVAVLVADAGGPRLALLSLADGFVTPLETLDGTQPLFRVTFESAGGVMLPETPDLVRLRHLALCVHAATLVGLMSWLLDATVEYAGQRVQFGVPIATRQAAKHRCASMLMALESSRAMVLELADAIENPGSETPAIAATALAWVIDAAEEVAGGAVQLHGGIGFTWELDVHHYFKRCTTGALLLGSAAQHRSALVAELRGSAAAG